MEPRNKKNPIQLINGQTEKFDQIFDFSIELADRPMRFELGVNDNDICISKIIPAAIEITTQILNTVTDSDKNADIPCRKGCSACCYNLIPISAAEAIWIAKTVISRSEKYSRNCLNSCKNILTGAPVGENFGQDLTELSNWYKQLALPCPFLQDNCCGIYSHRPFACREHFIIGSPDSCKTLSDSGNVVEIAAPMTDILVELLSKLEAKEPEAILLPLIPAWILENTERAQKKWNSFQIVENFCNIITEKGAQRIPVQA